MVGQGLEASIDQVAAVDFLDDLAASYERRFGRPPVALSHWDPERTIVESLSAKLRVPPLGEPYRYRYSFNSDVRAAVMEKLGYNARRRRLLLTENGTNAVLAVANALALQGIRRAKVLSPCYFATDYALRRFGIEVQRVHWIRNPEGFTLPPLQPAPDEAIWAESPVFGTGVASERYLQDTFADAVARGCVVVLDRSLCLEPDSLGQRFGEEARYITINAPHKAICVNGLKFGAATFGDKLYDAFDHWADILSGGLSLSAEAASRHFLTDNFEQNIKAVSYYLKNTEQILHNTLRGFSPQVEFDRSAVGYWRMVYIPGVPARVGDDRDWLTDLVMRSGAAPIPGTWSGCSEAWGFCFRVNLLRFDPQSRSSLRRLLHALVNDGV